MGFRQKSWMMVTGSCVLATASCGGPSDEAKRSGNGAREGEAYTAQDGGGDTDVQSSEPMDPQIFEQVKGMWAMQIEGLEVQTKTLKDAAVAYPDEQLSAMVVQLEKKVADMKKEFGGITVATSRRLETDFPTWMGSAQELVVKAGERMQEVVRIRAGTP